MRNVVSDIKGEPRLRVFENRVLKRIFGQKRDEMAEGWRKLHNEEHLRSIIRFRFRISV
jgi:hypothetical protein